MKQLRAIGIFWYPGEKVRVQKSKHVFYVIHLLKEKQYFLSLFPSSISYIYLVHFSTTGRRVD